MGRVAVIVAAAGKSSRFRDKEKKPFANLGGRAVWLRSAELFSTHDEVCQTLVVISPEDEEMFRRRYGANLAFMEVKIVLGGAERFDSVANALQELNEDTEFVAVHDAARPCLTKELFDKVLAEATKTGAALLAMPVSDTVKRGDKGKKVVETVSREGLWLAQTPQIFRRDWLEDAYGKRAELGKNITDDAQLVEAAGHAVHLVQGSSTNIKITTKDDLYLADAVLNSRPEPNAKRKAHPFEDENMW